MFFRSVLVFIAFLAAIATAHGQVNPAEKSTGGEGQATKEKDTRELIASKDTGQSVMRVDGILALSGYLGKKLLKELGNRMNLDETAKPNNPTPTKVEIHVGPFKVERMDNM